MAIVLTESRYTRGFRLACTAVVLFGAACITVVSAAVLDAPGLAIVQGGLVLVLIYLHLTTYEKLERIGERSVRLTRPLGTTEVALGADFTLRNGWAGPRMLVLRTANRHFRIIGTIGSASLVTDWLDHT